MAAGDSGHCELGACSNSAPLFPNKPYVIPDDASCESAAAIVGEENDNRPVAAPLPALPEPKGSRGDSCGPNTPGGTLDTMPLWMAISESATDELEPVSAAKTLPSNFLLLRIVRASLPTEGSVLLKRAKLFRA
ncbi:hypothetical protein MTO96_012800 [Rhipicephalus appendiculatus]